MERVQITGAALAVLKNLQQRHGLLLFHQSGGCCDGSAPMCLAQSDFRLGGQDLLLGVVADCPFYMSRDTYSYYTRSQITIDVAPGRGASFSLEIPLGVRFLSISRILDEATAASLRCPEALATGR